MEGGYGNAHESFESDVEWAVADCPRVEHTSVHCETTQVSDFVAEPPSRPEQSLPPWATPSHERVEVLVPVPQAAEHEPAVQPDHAPLTGHSLILQLSVLVAEPPSRPEQSLPPLTTPSHVRVYVCEPSPQDAEHEPCAVQVDQAPWTGFTPVSVQSPSKEWVWPSVWSNSRHAPWWSVWKRGKRGDQSIEGGRGVSKRGTRHKLSALAQTGILTRRVVRHA